MMKTLYIPLFMLLEAVCRDAAAAVYHRYSGLQVGCPEQVAIVTDPQSDHDCGQT